jgi:hypothetical protein
MPTNAFGTLPNVQKLDNCKGQGNNSVIKLVVPSKCTYLPTHSSNLSCSFIKFDDSLKIFSIHELKPRPWKHNNLPLSIQPLPNPSYEESARKDSCGWE